MVTAIGWTGDTHAHTRTHTHTLFLALFSTVSSPYFLMEESFFLFPLSSPSGASYILTPPLDSFFFVVNRITEKNLESPNPRARLMVNGLETIYPFRSRARPALPVAERIAPSARARARNQMCATCCCTRESIRCERNFESTFESGKKFLRSYIIQNIIFLILALLSVTQKCVRSVMPCMNLFHACFVFLPFAISQNCNR